MKLNQDKGQLRRGSVPLRPPNGGTELVREVELEGHKAGFSFSFQILMNEIEILGKTGLWRDTRFR